MCSHVILNMESCERLVMQFGVEPDLTVNIKVGSFFNSCCIVTCQEHFFEIIDLIF
jgi:hypothetical protein